MHIQSLSELWVLLCIPPLPSGFLVGGVTTLEPGETVMSLLLLPEWGGVR